MFLTALARDDGSSTIEYGLILGCIVLTALVSCWTLGRIVEMLFNSPPNSFVAGPRG